eukprot:1448311-Rhodomonas_salina.1
MQGAMFACGARSLRALCDLRVCDGGMMAVRVWSKSCVMAVGTLCENGVRTVRCSAMWMCGGRSEAKREGSRWSGSSGRVGPLHPTPTG